VVVDDLAAGGWLNAAAPGSDEGMSKEVELASWGKESAEGMSRQRQPTLLARAAAQPGSRWGYESILFNNYVNVNLF
jgi:hypothetical protein